MTLVCRRRRRLDTCVNDDSTIDTFGDTCSSWYDNSDNCSGDYDDSDFSSNVQCCKCGGSKRCDIVVSGTSHQSGKHGTYRQSGSCDDRPRWKCDDCSSSDAYIWYHESYSRWYIGNDVCGGYRGMEIYDPDEDLTAVSGTWSEYTGSEWQTNSGISVTCAAVVGYVMTDGNIKTCLLYTSPSPRD